MKRLLAANEFITEGIVYHKIIMNKAIGRLRSFQIRAKVLNATQQLGERAKK
jgi:hypothetical protein